ncbi:unnamed protein product [Closterium sp. NIES-64]|nr:unnamed protein product [Closterium sp. NIES-64]
MAASMACPWVVRPREVLLVLVVLLLRPKDTATAMPRGGASQKGAVLGRTLTRNSENGSPWQYATVMPRDTASKKGDLRVSILTTWLATGAQRHNNIRAKVWCCCASEDLTTWLGAWLTMAVWPKDTAAFLPRDGTVSRGGAARVSILTPCLIEQHYTSSDDWRRALARVVPAVVVLRVTVVRAFDTESANSSYATGFIVDRRRGIILTNRHVVKPGPVVAEAMFLNREEVPVHPIYRDPVHDFGFFHFDPAAVQFLDYQDIPLAPEAAAVGLEIRVVGNDSGEKVSILAGTIARLDRDAPVYKKDGYNDFNTFYLQAASGTKGGSSGSPVIDSRGCAVALNAGSKSSSASAFFLPLDRVVRALGAIQACFAEKEGGGFVVHKWRPPVVTRGTLQVTLIHKGFDETRRLGLRRETEAEVRREAGAAETGLLVVDSLVPGGPAEGRLEPGDILVRVNGKVLTQFLALEAILDDTVGGTVTLDVERGGTPLSLALTVHDLHAVTPDRFLELSGGVLHALSYQQARNFRFPCGLVYVAEPGYMLSRAGVPRFAIIQKLADQDVPDLETFLRVFARLEAGARMPIEYVTHGERHRPKSVLLLVDRHACAHPVHVPSSVMVDGVHAQHFFGTALVVHHTAQLGLIVVDRNTVAVSVSDIMLSFSAYPVEVPGEVVFLHPVHNFAFVAYDPSALGAAAAAAVKPATLKPSPALRRGDRVHLVGLSRSQAVTSRQSVVTNPTATLTVGAADCPRYRAINMDVVEIDTDFGQSFSGVLADDSGAVRALWGSFSTFAGEAGEGTRRAEAHEEGGKGGEQQQQQAAAGTENSLLMNGRLWAMPRMRVLEAELAPMLLSKARSFGLSEQWVHVLARADPVRRQVLRVKGTLAGSAVAGVLQQGDMLLAVNGRPVTCFADVEAACCELDAGGSESAGMLEGDGGSGVRDGAGAVVAAAAGEEAAGNGHVSETGDREPIGATAAGADKTAVNGTAEAAVEAPGKTGGKEDAGVAATTAGEAAAGEAGRASLSLTILRQGREQRVQAGTDVRHGFGTTRVVNWAGCLVQDPHPAVRATGFLPSQGHGAYVARWCHGSPAHRYGLYALHWIVEINGRPVPDLDALVAISQELEHGAFVRVKVVHLNGKPRVLTLKQDLHYWPTWELRFVPSTGTWQRTIHKIQK